MLRSLADRLEAVRRTLPAAAASGHPAETAWPMTHLVGIAADASDEYLFRIADPAADSSVLAAFATATSHSGQALASLANASELLLGALPGAPGAARAAIERADDLAALAVRGLRTAADRAPAASAAPVVALGADELQQRRTAQWAAAAAKSTRIVSTHPAGADQTDLAAPTAPVIPLRRGR